MKAETYAKKYGGTVDEWDRCFEQMKQPQKVMERNGKYTCPVCGHEVRQFKKCSYCSQTLTK